MTDALDKLNETLQRRFGVKAVQCAERGRDLVATRALKAGSLVLLEANFAAALHRDCWPNRCAWCFAKDAASCCSKCHTAFYCSPACQRSDFVHHKRECGALLRGDASALPTTNSTSLGEIALLGRVLRQTTRSQLRRVPENAGTQVAPVDEQAPLRATYEQVEAMAAVDSASADGSDAALVEATVAMFDESEARVAQMLRRFKCNNFGVCDELNNLLGQGVFVLGSLINHACGAASNVVHTYVLSPVYGPVQAWFAFTDIAEGEFLTHAYVDPALPAAQRRAQLRERYAFECKCAVCESDDVALGGEKWKQLACDGQTVLADRDAERAFDEGLEKAARIEELVVGEEELEKEIKLLLTVLQLRAAKLHKYNLQVVKTHSALANSFLMAGALPLAIKHFALLIDGYRRFYPPAYPILGINLSILGELLAVANKPEAALLALNEAHKIMILTRGRTSSVSQTIKERIDSIELTSETA